MAACAVPMTLLCRTESGRRQLKRMDLGGEESGGPVRLAKPEPAASKACSDRGTRSAASEVRVAIKGVRQGVSQAETGSSPPTGSQPWQSPISPASPMTIFPAMARSEEHTSELQSLMRISYAV